MRFPSICVRDNRELIRVTILDHQVILDQNALPWNFPRRSRTSTSPPRPACNWTAYIQIASSIFIESQSMPELQQSLLLFLAPELIEAITDEVMFIQSKWHLDCWSLCILNTQLTIDAVKVLRLTCKQLGDLLNPRIFRELTINFSQATYENDLSKVRILATTNRHPASSGTRTLNITSLSPAYDPDFRGPSWRKVDDEWFQEPYPEDPPEVLVAEEELKGYLFKAIASLKGVQSVA